jgi:ABC-2 type transport system permease protein
MTNLIRAEFRKLFTTQVWFWLLIGSLALTALIVVANVATTASQTEYIQNVSSIYGAAGVAYIFVLVLGIIGITAEFRHQTITPTLLTTPSRTAVVAAKLVSYLLVGTAYAAAGVVVTLLIAVPWLSGKGIELSLGDYDIPRTLLAGFIIASLYALLGVGIGALITNQAAAITLSIVYFLVIEGLLSIIPWIRVAYPYLPGGAAAAMRVSNAERHQQYWTYLSPVAGAAVLIGWALAFSAAGVWRMRRDVS